MFSRMKITTSTGNYSDNIKKLKRALAECDAVVIGAGAGLSTSAGILIFLYLGCSARSVFIKYNLFSSCVISNLR